MTGPLNMNGFAINNIATGNSASSVATLGQAMPIGAMIEWPGASAPAGWALCYGQAISRTTYAALFNLIGETYGAGDGSTTFNLPDERGRVSIGKDDMGGTAAGRITAAGSGIAGTTLGATGGVESVSLVAANLPAHTHSGTTGVSNQSLNHSHTAPGAVIVGAGQSGGEPGRLAASGTLTTSAVDLTGHNHNFTTDGGAGLSGSTHVNVQPAIVKNKIIRVSYDG
jgi:microcystin-dependent protein